MTRIDEIVDGIYRICTPVDVGGYDFQFNQFLIDDERPALIHTGMHGMYDDVGGSLGRETIPDFVRALREESFAFQGMVLGRELGVGTADAKGS